MAFKLQTQATDWLRIKNPQLSDAFKEDLAVFYYQDLMAPAAAVHAAFASDNAAAITTGIQPLITPCSLQCDFTALWDGGDVTIIGTDQWGRAITETFADNPGAAVEGTKIFRTVTSINQETVGAGGALTCTVNTGVKVGLPLPLKSAFGVGMADGVAELWTWDATYHAFTPATTPDATVDFTAIIPVDWAKYEQIQMRTLVEVSVSPSLSPSISPSISPSYSPSLSPSISPSYSPSISPSYSPSISPSLSPSYSPSISPSKSPSKSPSYSPSLSPSLSPSRSPSLSPSLSPSRSPSLSPSLSPSISPSPS